MPRTTSEHSQTLNQSVNAMLEQPKPLSEKKKQKKVKGWKKALLRIVFPVRAFSSGSKKGSKAISPDANTITTDKSSAGTSNLTGEGAFDVSPSSAAATAATAVSKQLYALAAPKLPLPSSLALSSPIIERNAGAPTFSLPMPTPTIPTITITPTTPISTFPPMGLNMDSDAKEVKKDGVGERTAKERDVLESPPPAPIHADYFGAAFETPSTSLFSVQGEEQSNLSSTNGAQLDTFSSYSDLATQLSSDLPLADAAASPEPSDAVVEVESGEKKKNKKKKNKTKKGSNLNPTNLIGQAMELSPNPLDVVKKGINSAASASANVGSIMNSGNNAVSTLVSSAPVSALGGANKFAESLPLKRKDFDLIIPIGPVAFVLKGHVERANLEIDAALHVKVGFVTHKLGKVQGNLRTGVRIKFGLSGVLTGQARFYMPVKGEKGKKKSKAKNKNKDQDQDESQAVAKEKENDAEAGGERSKWLWLDIKVTVFKEDIGPLSLPLVPLRFGNHKKNNSEARSVRSISISVIEDVEDGSGQLTTVRRSIDVDAVGRHRRSTSITTTVDYHPNHLSQLEAFSFCSSAGNFGRSLDVYAEPSFSYDYEEVELEVEEVEGGKVGFMVGYHS